MLGLLGLAAAFAPGAKAQTVFMNQIGSNAAFFTGGNAYTSQVFSDYPTYSIAAVDDFSVPSVSDITNVTAALLGFSGFTSFSNVTGYEVNIYSSQAAAVASLNGNVAHLVLNPALATLTTPYSGDALSGLVSLPVNIVLPAAGTYYVSVLADLAFGTGGELGLYTSTGQAGITPGNANGFQANPGGGFGFTGNVSQFGTDFAYRVSGVAVPEPSTYAMFGLGVVALVGALRSRRAGAV